ncbi:MAG: DUF4316 domain-containing protein [Oscillospiraceae bacterium]|jgi:hypothetical protein|nr:DUF4316 domain-containing protein [Oscillospiraceae bacterium]
MRQNYTRQRQGRDFSLLDEVNHLRNAEMSVEGNYNQIDGILGNNIPKPGSPSSIADWGGKDDFEAKTMREQLEYYRAQAERNAAPVDGREPSPERGL